MKITKDEFFTKLNNKELNSFTINGKRFYSEKDENKDKKKEDPKYEKARKEFKEFLDKKPLPTYQQCLKKRDEIKKKYSITNLVLPFGKKRWEELKNKEKYDVKQSEKKKKKDEEMKQAEQDSKNLNKTIWKIFK